MARQTNEIPMGLTYDDVLLTPLRSSVTHRSDVSTKTQLTKTISLSVPFVSANMDTVTESAMAISLAHCGGIGMIHRFMSIERQVNEIKRVKRHEGFILDRPFTIHATATLNQVKQAVKKYNVESFIVIDEEEKVVGLITRRDMLFANENEQVTNLMTPLAKLIYAKPSIGV